MKTNTPADDVGDFFTGTQDHGRLDHWLKGAGIDKALKAMNRSAVAKKPGRVVKRLVKELGDLFRTPRVIAWEKGRKNVYTSALSVAPIEDVVMEVEETLPGGRAVFQTDLYFRANEEVTEVNASTIAAIREDAACELITLRPGSEGDIESEIQRALTLVRIFQTGFGDAGLEPADIRQFLVPNGDDAMVVACLPVRRMEIEEEKVGQVALILKILAAAELSEEARDSLSELARAMTREGHPGAEAFGQLVAARAEPIDPALF